MFRTIFFLLCLLVASSTSYSEIYQGIGPIDTLGEVKSKFPNAVFTKINPAWAQETDALYQISGTGMSGTIVINFFDARPLWDTSLRNSNNSDDLNGLKELANGSDDTTLTVGWVRWVPDRYISLTRFISKYGNPEKQGFTDDALQPYRTWEAKGLTAYLTDDEKNVIRVDYDFTKDEMKKAYLQKYGSLPPFLKN